MGPFMKSMSLLRLVTVVALVIVFIYATFFIYKTKVRPNEGFTPYSSYPQNNALDAMNTMVLAGDRSDCEALPGLNGLQCSPTTSDKLLDPFYGFQSSQDCEGSGLTREGGNICLTKTQRALLTTRGGNAVYDAQIGQP